MARAALAVEGEVHLLDPGPPVKPRRPRKPPVAAKEEGPNAVLRRNPDLDAPLRVIWQLCDARTPLITGERVSEHAGCTWQQAEAALIVASTAKWVRGGPLGSPRTRSASFDR